MHKEGCKVREAVSTQGKLYRKRGCNIREACNVREALSTQGRPVIGMVSMFLYRDAVCTE